MDMMRTGEYFLKSLTRDEEFEVSDEEGKVVLEAGDMVSFNRGDRVLVMFNALSAEPGESFPQ
jgi:hypothetical protein